MIGRRPRGGPRRSGRRRAVEAAVALLCGAGALFLFAAPDRGDRAAAAPRAPTATRDARAAGGTQAAGTALPAAASPMAGGLAAPGGGATTAAPSAAVRRGRELFVQGCSACHGLGAHGLPRRGPSLHGAGEQAADFYLSTGRMPLPDPRAEPVRTAPKYPPRETAALIAYIGSLGGPPIPRPDPARGTVAEGRELFTDRCAGCHQVLAQGGIAIGAVAPALQVAEPRQIAEAVRIGPYLMPRFSHAQLSDRELDSVIAYVLWTRHIPDAGGWGIGHIGPIPEGMIAWLLAGVALLITLRIIGEGMAESGSPPPGSPPGGRA